MQNGVRTNSTAHELRNSALLYRGRF